MIVIKHFLEQIGTLKFTLACGLLMAILNALCDLFWPTIIETVVDDGIIAGDPGHIRKMLIIMIVVAILTAFIKYAKNTCAILTGNRYMRSTRRQLFDKVMSLSGGDVGQFGAATLVTRGTNDISAVGNMLDSFIRVMVRIPFTCIAGLIMAYIVDVRMALIITAVVPVILIVSIYMLKSTRPIYGKIQNALDLFNGVLRERLRGVRVIRVFCRDGYEQERLEVSNSEMTDLTMDVDRRIGLLNPLMTLLVNITVLGLIVFAMVTAQRNTLRIGALISCIMYANQILTSVVASTMILSRLPRTAVSIRRIDEILSYESSVTETGTAVPEGDTDALTFDHACYRYPGASRDAVSDLSFTLRKGRVTAVIGSTGCGKTTLLSLAERFIDTTEGSVRIGSTEYRDLAVPELRKRVAVVPQQAFLFEGSIRDNMHYGCPEADDGKITEALKVACADEFVFSNEAGLDYMVSSGGSNLSGGQKQRLAIARALIGKPDFILFDDSFSALDMKTDAEVRHRIKAYARDTGLLIVAQRINTIRDADEIIVLDDGHIVGRGTHSELMASCRVYREIAESQYEGGEF